MADTATLIGRPSIGQPTRRVDGPLKVSGGARYAGEYFADDLLHGYVVSGSIAKGRILSIDTSAAMAIPGVVEVFTHENRPRTAWFDSKYQDQVAPPGSPFRPLYGDGILYSGQPIALVVAESFEAARDAAALVKATYAPEEHITDLDAVKGQSYVPPKKRSGIAPPPEPRGDAEAAFAKAPVKVHETYRVAVEHHNPMEPFATTVVRDAGGKLTIYDKTQGSQNAQAYVTGVFGLNQSDVTVVNAFVGGAFGIGLRPQHQLFLAVMAAQALERSVRVVLTRDQMFTLSYRPETIQTLSLGSAPGGKLDAIMHHAVAGTSHFEDYQEVVVNWAGLLYGCDNVKLSYELAKIDTYTPSDMRAPGATLGVFALESAMDELAYAAGVDPLQLRLTNYADFDQNEDKKFTSKALISCYEQGAERFGWSKRSAEPRSMRDGHELVGWGMATGVWEAKINKTAARASLTETGHLEVSSATSDIGTGTYTVMALTGADAFGLPIEHVTARLGDSSLPTAPVEGGSWAAASTSSAVVDACDKLKQALFKQAQSMPDSPFGNVDFDGVAFRDGRMMLAADEGSSVKLGEIVRSARQHRMEAEGSAAPDSATQKEYVSYTHSAIFVEVKVDEELGVVRVTRIVNAVAAGKILNPKAARSQILGGVVMAMGAALEEETFADHNLGRFMNHNFAEYHVPVNADVQDIDVIFVEEPDDKTSPIGAKGIGEIGIVGTTAAIANAVYHATGKRIRDLPITIDKILA
ncbi:xanthine dehydrogenase YagR molybdenum-binding subunit [Faunimonas pinastri]|uniref:Xanthine dehydrogenase YagR molybdenum-binding subunit n=1 Tax=Faunimonas pinastri TaxID=1855383 RepID=A0A1H9JZK7_9HYPH|nr:xanthine dehydrogenase family protein molybdopterin-binding subunit [Faunimonas pinastri]SEQ91965.1 xanthine dehydrogenase YagR molybdenum-binding subunit [Faunimonas pinastri]